MPVPTQRSAVIVGRRRAALRACSEEGLAVHQISERRRPRAPTGGHRPLTYRRLEMAAPEEEWRRVARELASSGVEVVLAATETAVVPAAWIREELALPGLDPDTALRCCDKVAMKRAIRRAGLPCADFVAGGAAEGGQSETGAALIDRLGLPLVVKRRVGSGGRDTRVVRTSGEVPERLEEGWMAEAFVAGREMSVESWVVGGEPRSVNFTEYLEPRWANIAPAAVGRRLHREISTLNRAAIGALGVERGVTHLEVYLTERGVVFGELGARPPGGHIMDLVAAAHGWDPWRAWVRVELGRRPRRRPRRRTVAGVWVLHPGPGRVRSIEGVEAARAAPGVECVVLRARPDGRIEERKGVGQEVGFILVTGSDRDEAERRLRRARGLLSIQMKG